MSRVAAALVSLGVASQVDASPDPCRGPDRWDDWCAYRTHFISKDGRVVDKTAGDRTTSEGQAYALFHALVANDRATFERVLAWTELNLARGSLSKNLPAWEWGRAPEGRWRVLDANSASDADLWIAYSLLESSRLWSAPSHRALAERITEQIVAKEIEVLPGLGPMLLPAPAGFTGDERWRLNPSYLPLHILRRFAAAGVPGPWSELADTTARLLRESAPMGYVPDWVAYTASGGFAPDPKSGPIGSYDAIRAYLWAALLAPEDPHEEAIRKAVAGMYDRFASARRVPERVDTAEGALIGDGPIGFVAALLPEAVARGDVDGAASIRRRVAKARRRGLYGKPPAYYDQNLVLFALGFADGWYRLNAGGELEPRWRKR